MRERRARTTGSAAKTKSHAALALAAVLPLLILAQAARALPAPHIYWANSVLSAIGEARLNGTGVEQRFITGAREPTGVAVDAAHLYWANAHAIAKARLNGTHIVQRLVRTHEPYGVAVSQAGAVRGNR